uniref:Uncharacterized protein n=1 Tax=Tetranychus urticae TaxID=32264 RepID=T1KIH0_TETUR
MHLFCSNFLWICLWIYHYPIVKC